MPFQVPWNPWRVLRDRPWLVLRIGDLGRARGLLVDDGTTRTVWLDYRLGRRARNATLTHELVHDDRDLLYDRSTPPLLVAKEEATVRAETARRLIPPEALRALSRSGEVFDAHQLAVCFDTTDSVARTALDQWARVLDAAPGRRSTGPRPPGHC